MSGIYRWPNVGPFLAAALGPESRPALHTCCNVAQWRGKRVAVTVNGHTLHMVEDEHCTIPDGTYTLLLAGQDAILTPSDLKYPDWPAIVPDVPMLPMAPPQVLSASAAKSIGPTFAAALWQDGRCARLVGYVDMSTVGGGRIVRTPGNSDFSVVGGDDFIMVDPRYLHVALAHMGKGKAAIEAGWATALVLRGVDKLAVIMGMIGNKLPLLSLSPAPPRTAQDGQGGAAGAKG